MEVDSFHQEFTSTKASLHLVMSSARSEMRKSVKMVPMFLTETANLHGFCRYICFQIFLIVHCSVFAPFSKVLHVNFLGFPWW